MIKYFNGNHQNTSVEAAMNHINLYLNGRQKTDGTQEADMLVRRYEELTAYIEQMNEEFDLTQIHPAATGSGIKGLVKKLVGKCVGWYVKDMNKRQTDFNMHLICALNSERAILEELIRRENGSLPRQG